MKAFLKKIKLIENFSTELIIEKNDFIKKFQQHVDESEFGLFSDLRDLFSSSKNEFKGNVGLDAFKIKKRKRFFDSNLPLSAEGIYRQKGENLVIEAEIKGQPNAIIPFVAICLIFYTIAFFVILLSDNMDWRLAAVVVPFLFIHAAFMLGIPYYMMRKSVKRLKHDLERELYYITKPGADVKHG